MAEDRVSSDRLNSRLMVPFAATALALAGAGVYGLLAYGVAERTSEFGVRLALGESPTGIVRDVLREGTRLVLLGFSLGLAAAFVLARLLESQLFGVGLCDLGALLGTVVLLLAAGTLARLVPAWRACRVDPLSALHHN